MLQLDHFQNCTDCPLVALGGMQVIMLEGANATTETVAALRTGAMTMKALQKTTNIDDVDKTIDDINEQTESFKQIQDALSTPFDMGIDIDEVLVTFLL
jgi:charged multivesicular body protein 4